VAVCEEDAVVVTQWSQAADDTDPAVIKPDDGSNAGQEAHAANRRRSGDAAPGLGQCSGMTPDGLLGRSTLRGMEPTTSRGYTSGRRQGLSGLLGFYRGVVRDDRGHEVLRARSAEVAKLLARILNGDAIEGRTVDESSGLSRYSVQADPRDSHRKAVVGVLSTVRDRAWFGNGLIATTENETIARKIAAEMNRLDPEKKKRGQRGIGWW